MFEIIIFILNKKSLIIYIMPLSPLDLSLQNKYRNAVIGVGFVNNTSSNTTLGGNVTASSDLFVSSNTIIENNSTVKSNLFVSNNTIFNSNVNVNSYYSCNSISLQNITIKSNLNVSGNMTLVGNTSILSNLIGLGNLNSNSLQVNGNINVNSNILNQTTMLSNLNILGNANIKNITPINTLFISGITILQDTTINSTLNISSTGLLNNITINNSLNISSNCILNSVSINSQLLVSNYLVINNNLTVNSSLSINTNSVFNNSVSTGSLICYLNSNIKNSSTINSFLNVSGVSVFNSNITGLGDLNVSGNTVVNGISTILSSLYVSNNTNINNNIIANNTSTINSSLTVSGNTTLVNLTGPNSIVMNQIPEYFSNQDAADGGIPLWGYYRTGGILKIRTDTVSPIITLTGSNNITLYAGQTYTELGATATDNLDISIPIIITGTVNILQVGVYVLRYTAIDSYNNQSFVTRTINIILDIVTPTIQLNGSNVMKLNINDNYIELGITSADSLGNNLIPVITGTVNTLQLGKYLITYTVTDASGNTNSITRTIYVLNTNTQPAYQMNNPNTYLSFTNNYNALTTTQYWTIECWIYLTAYSSTNYYTVFDFRNIPNTISNAQFALIISNTGMLGYWYGSTNSSNFCPGSSNIPLNTWTHIAYQRNGIFMDFYVNGTFAGNLNIGTLFNSPNISNLNQVTLGYNVSQSITSNTFKLLGSISQTKISLGNKYTMGFVPNNDLSYDLTNTLFSLTNNYSDSITNSQMTYNSPPIIANRQYFIKLISNTIESRNLVFNLQVSNLSTTWIDTTGNYTFVVHPNANNYSSLSKTQNGYGWRRSGNIGWTMNNSSSITFKNINWSEGYTLEQWIYIDYDFIPSTTVSMLLAGQSSMFNTNDYGFAFNQINFPYNTNNGNVLAYTCNSQGAGLRGINLNNLRGKWTHLVATNSNQTKLIPYYNTLNGCLYINNNNNIIQSQLITGDFTIEGWFYRTGGLRILWCSNISIYISEFAIAEFLNVSLNTGTIPISLNTWVHVAYVRTGTNMKIYVNGVLDISFFVYSTLNTNDRISFGGIYGALIGGNGNISQICISNYQKYTSNFTPSQDLSSTINSNTIFFLSDSFTDSTSNNVLNIYKTVTISNLNISYNILNLYLNGGLLSTLTSYTNWGSPALSTNLFTIGCNSNNGTIQSESLNRVHFGNTRMYSRPLLQDEILNNYNIELPYYQTPTSDIYFIKSPNTISSNTITNYDFTSGWLSQSIDLNQLRVTDSWTIECWAYPTSWGSSNDGGWIIDLSVGSNYLAFGVTSSITNITPSITYDGSGRPFIYYSGDTIGQWKIKSSQIVPLNQWNHIVWQKNNVSTLEMFVNGISTGTFTVNASDWNYPNFVSVSGINNIIIGGSTINLSSTTNHWKGKLSQVKITLGKKYTGPFTSLFDLSVNDNGLFLLQDNFFNNSIGKTMTNNNVIIPTYSSPKIIIIGSNSLTLFAGINTYTELGYNVSYYQRTLNLSQNIIGNVDASTIGFYSITYTAIDSLLNIGYGRRSINVIKYNIPPIISLNGSPLSYLQLGTTYNELGVTITNNLSQTIIPVITGSVNTSIIGQYIITYTATDSYGNSASVARTLIVFNIPINGISFWLDPSNNSTITKDSANTVTNIRDISENNIIMNINLGSPKLSTNTINNLTVLDLTNGSSMISNNSYQNSADITMAVIATFFNKTYYGLIFGHYPDGLVTPAPNNNQWYQYDIALMNGGTNFNNIILFSGNDQTVGIPFLAGVQVMYIGVLSKGTFRYLKMINLQTGQEITTNGTNISTIQIMNSFYWLGMPLKNRSDTAAKCYIGEVMYWKRVLSSIDILNIENYLFNKWGNKNATLTYTTLTPKIIFNGSSKFYLNLGFPYTEPGITLENTLEPNLVPVITGTYDINTPGTYTLTYTVTDSMNNSASANRNIIVTNSLPVNTYDTTYGSMYIQNSPINYNVINNTDWTFECWLNRLVNTGGENVIIDFTPINQGQASPNFKLATVGNKLTFGWGIFGGYISASNATIPINEWCHCVWMRKNNALYTFINGVCSPPLTSIIDPLNNLSQYNMNSLLFGIVADLQSLNNITHFTGQMCQMSLLLGAKYSTSGFIPNWNLTPSNYTNVLFWLQNNIDVISNKSIVLSGTMGLNTLYSQPMIPTLALNGKQYNYVIVNQTYTDPGVTVYYSINPNIIPYITSITDNNGNQFITTPLNALNSNIISNLNTGVVNTIYTITYSVKYTSTESITSTRIITVLLTALPTTLYRTGRPNVFTDGVNDNFPINFYYIKNGVYKSYTSKNSVKLTNGTDIIYYMDNFKVIPSNLTTTDSNGIMWTTIGLMTMQVYNPMNYSINYNNNSYSLYINTNVLLNSNGVYKNNNGNDFVYQYQDQWYYSTDMITFYKILFDSTNSIVVGQSSTSPIYLYNNMVLTTLPSIQTTNNKTYWNFGIVYVNPINLSDCYLYYNDTIYYQQTPQNSYKPGSILSRFTPTYISSGTLFSKSNNTIIFQICLGFIIITTPNSVANFIRTDGTLDNTNIYNNLNTSGALGYSSKSGYFISQSYQLYGNKGWTLPSANIAPNLIGTVITDINSTNTLAFVQYNSGFIIVNNYQLWGYNCTTISCKPTGTGTLQYVIPVYTDPNKNFDRWSTRQPYIYGSGLSVGYISFETTSYFTVIDGAYHWDDINKKFTNQPFNLNCINLNFNYYINPACLEPFTFNNIGTIYNGRQIFDNTQIVILDNQQTTLPVPTSNFQTVGFAANLFGYNSVWLGGIAVPAARLLFLLAARGNWAIDGTNTTVNQYNSDFSYNGNIITTIFVTPTIEANNVLPKWGVYP